MTFLIGLALVVVSVAALIPMMFPGDPEPATLEPMTQRAGPPEPDPPVSRGRIEPPLVVRVAETVSIHPAWWERLRGVLGLALLTMGVAATIALAMGLAVLVLGRSIL